MALSLSDQLAQLLAGGEAAIKAKKEAKKKIKVNTYKDIVVKEVNGKFQTEIVDRRLADPRWATSNRILLVRKVTCQHCGVSHIAPNEVMMVKKSHPVHGMIEEAIGLHDAGKFAHLPVIIEQHNTTIAYCQNCVNYIKVEIIQPQLITCTCPAPDLLALFPVQDSTATPIIEEELDPDETGWEDTENLAALEDM